MFCKDCGTQLENGTRFCPNCGSAQAVTPPPRPVIPPTAPVPFAEKVRATAKKVGSSPAFLAATICFTLVQFLGLLSLISASSTFAYGDLFADQDLLAYTKSLSLVTGFVGFLPAIVIAAGLWITYGACASRKPKVNTSGLTMIFVVSLVQLVFTCIILLIALLFFIFAIPGTNYADYPHHDAAYLKTLLVISLVTVLTVFILVLLYAIKICTTISNVRSTLKTGVPNKRASRFVGVMCFISSAFLILNGIGDLLNAGLQTLDGFYDESLPYILPSTFFLSGISALLTAATQILFGVLIFSYRSKMAALEAEERMNNFRTLSHAEPYTSPVYIPPQPAEEPAPAPEAVEEAPEPEVTEEAAEPEEITEPATEEETN